MNASEYKGAGSNKKQKKKDESSFDFNKKYSYYHLKYATLERKINERVHFKQYSYQNTFKTITREYRENQEIVRFS
jgi:hypothetical protein